MTMCPNTPGHHCVCQPQDGEMCPNGPQPPFKPWASEMTDESIAAEPVAWLWMGDGHVQSFTLKPPPSMLRDPKCHPLYLHPPEVLRASSGIIPSEAMRAAYIELRDAFGDHDRFDTLLSKYAEACTAMGVAIASFRAPMISLDAVAAEPSGEAQDQSTRHTQGGQDEFDAWRQS